MAATRGSGKSWTPVFDHALCVLELLTPHTWDVYSLGRFRTAPPSHSTPLACTSQRCCTIDQTLLTCLGSIAPHCSSLTPTNMKASDFSLGVRPAVPAGRAAPLPPAGPRGCRPAAAACRRCLALHSTPKEADSPAARPEGQESPLRPAAPSVAWAHPPAAADTCVQSQHVCRRPPIRAHAGLATQGSCAPRSTPAAAGRPGSLRWHRGCHPRLQPHVTALTTFPLGGQRCDSAPRQQTAR